MSLRILIVAAMIMSRTLQLAASEPGPQGGWRVIEVWESEEEARRFVREELAPALRAAGAQGPPPSAEFWPLHRMVTGVRT